jgi:hypothetical protein
MAWVWSWIGLSGIIAGVTGYALALRSTAGDGSSAGAAWLNLTLRPPAPSLDHPPQNLNRYLLSPDEVILAKSADEEFTDPAHFGEETIRWQTDPLPGGDSVMHVVLYFGIGVGNPYTLSWEVRYVYR